MTARDAKTSAKSEKAPSDHEHVPISGNTIPIYKVDLSLQPRKRYEHIAKDLAPHLRSLTGLFGEVVQSFHPKIPLRLVNALARLSLRRLWSDEQTEELRGISTAAEIDMYLLVCFNTLLDLFMGCSSGCARVRRSANTKQPSLTRLLHFRTLDWDMDPLREVVVQLDFVKSPGTGVIARSITYAGFVGVLTGVRYVS